MRAVGRAATLLSLVLAGTVVLAAYLVWSSRSKVDDRPLADLASAVGPTLPFQARLTGGFAPSQGPTVLRSEGAASTRLSPDTRIAIAQIEKRAAADPSVESLAALGVAYLVQGDLDRSISTLQDAASMGEAAAPLSDLSAAYLAKAERLPARRIEYFSRALEAASQSLKRAPTDEARFNRALAIDGLTPFVGETQPWTEYVNAERDPRWLEVAKKHVADDKPVDDVRERWARRQDELRDRLTKLDRAFVEETVRMFPEASIELFEQELLVGWAKATLAKDVAASQSMVARAGVLAEVIANVTGDRMPAAEVGSIRSGGTELAVAHVAYADGIRRYDVNDHAGAQTSFQQALKGFSRSPYRYWASTQLATISYQRVDLNDAQRRLATIEPVATKREYRTLLGRTLRLRGLVYTRQWHLTEALAAYRRAASHFEQAGQRENAVGVYSNLADTLRTLGEQQESWINIGKTLEGLQRIRKPAPRYLFLYSASLFASSQDLFEAALLFQNATVREASQAAPAMLVDALTQRAVVHHRRGDEASARADLNRSLQQLKGISDGAIKQYLQAEIDVLAAQLDRSSDDPTTLDGLEKAIGLFTTADPNRVPRLYLGLARAHAARHSPVDAEHALDMGIARLESQQAGLSDQALRISYFDESWDLFHEMITFQLSTRNDPDKAFEYAERARARSLLATAGGPATLRPVREIAAMLPRSTVFVYYVTLPERLLIWRVDLSGSRLIERSVGETELNRLVAKHRSSIIERRDSQPNNDRLYDLVLAPVASTLSPADTLVVAPDGQLQQLPFGTLRNPATGRYFVEDHTVLVTPSASFFVTGRDRTPPPQPRLISALLIGNPTTASTVLPGAEAEVHEAAKVYPRPAVLTGDAATKERFIKAAPENDVVHFGGHAYVNPEYPLLSRLAFTAGGSAESESLFAHEISRLRFSRTQVVVLAACSTAAGSVSRGEGVVSMARPFLGAGVPTVVASQWDVDDRATQQLFLEFHRRLAQTSDSVGALRAAQLTLLKSENALFASPASWGAFVALGTIAR